MNKKTKVLYLLVLIYVLDSCGNFKIKPLNKTTPENYNCYGEPDNSRAVYSPIEEELNHKGSLKSKKINMASEVGMMEKTIRLYVLNKSEIRILIYLVHPIDIELKNYGFEILGDSGKLASGEMHVDYRATIGEMSEEKMDISYPMEVLDNLSNDKNVSIRIENMLFNIPFACRETFREIRNEIR